jgi:hypothetical protein
MFFAGADAQACDFKQIGKRGDGLRTRGSKTGLWTGCDRRIPQPVFEIDDCVLLLERKKFGLFPQRIIVRHAIQVNPGLNIVFEFNLQIASNIAFEQSETIVSRRGSVCLLDNKLSAFVKTLQSARNHECQE